MIVHRVTHVVGMSQGGGSIQISWKFPYVSNESRYTSTVSNRVWYCA